MAPDNTFTLWFPVDPFSSLDDLRAAIAEVERAAAHAALHGHVFEEERDGDSRDFGYTAPIADAEAVFDALAGIIPGRSVWVDHGLSSAEWDRLGALADTHGLVLSER